ncbi:MAG: DUF4114 domain-containing protein [Planctomycetales bacterium]|nr:DUF4114 domain-containing protein [Planctomycetales bacterium]
MFHRKMKSNIRNKRLNRSVLFEALEARRLLTHYFVNAETGDNGNTGTEEAPFRSYLPFVEAYGQSDANIGKIELQPGDIVEFAPGLYSDSFRIPNTDGQGFYLRGVSGTEEAPIVIRGNPGTVIDARPADGKEFSSIFLFQSEHIVLEGLEFTGLGRGLRLMETNNITAKNLWFHDIDGRAEGNIAAIEIHSSSDVEVFDSFFTNNYDHRQNHQNSRHVVLFQNPGHIHLHHNIFQNDDPPGGAVGGAGVDVKHGADGSYEFDHNIIINATNSSIGTSTPRTKIHHNLSIDSAAISVRDFGGAAYFNDILINNNTQVSQSESVGGGLSYFPTECWYVPEEGSIYPGCNPNIHPGNKPIDSYHSIGKLQYSDNIVVDTRSYRQDISTVRVSTYGTDRIYQEVVERGNLVLNDNVYHVVDGQPEFDLFSVNGGTRGELGARYSFTEWQQQGYDENGLAADPMLDDAFLPLNVAASTSGWYDEPGRRLTVFLGEDNIVSEGHMLPAVVVRSGTDLDLAQPLTVQLIAADGTEIAIPQTVSFLPGESKAYFAISGILDNENDGTRASAIYAKAEGFSNNIAAWVRVEDSGQAGEPEFFLFETQGGSSVGEDGSTDTFTIRLNTAPASNVVLNVSSSDEGEVVVSPRDLLFTPTNWAVAQTVTLTGVDDGAVDGQQVSNVTVAVDTTSDLAWRGLADQVIAVTTADNDDRRDEPGYQGGVLVLPGNSADRLTLSFDWIERLGDYDNELGVLVVDDIDGTVDGIAPNQPNYAQVALRDESRQVLFRSGTGQGASTELEFHGGNRLVFYLIQNATTELMLAANPTNDFNVQPMSFFSLVDANGDQFNHVQVTETEPDYWRFGWEDLVAGGDRSFTDAVIDVKILPSETDELVFLDLVLADHDGNSLTEVGQSEVFFLDIYAEDLRQVPSGVFSASLDVVFDPSLVELVEPIEFGETYVVGRHVDLSFSGVLNELGAATSSFRLNQRELLARVALRAVATGELQVSADSADMLPEHDVTLLGMNSAVPTSRVRYDTARLTINPPAAQWHNSAFPVDVNDDGILSPIDALLIINMINARGAQSVDSLPIPPFMALIDTNKDQFLSPLDVLLVINALNQASAFPPPEGENSPWDEDDSKRQFADAVDQLLSNT